LLQTGEHKERREKDCAAHKELQQCQRWKDCAAHAVLHERGIINTPEYWLKNAVKGKMLKGEYVALLIQRTAEFIEP